MSDFDQSGDSLIVIAHKIGRRLFDLSTDLDDFSIRDQIVRAAMFAKGLVESGACKKGDKVLIVGAGVAGVTCGATLAGCGIGVRVLESRDSPFAILKAAHHRYVSPFMYEWPNVVSESHSFPSFMGVQPAAIPANLPQWESEVPISGADLFKRLVKWLDRFLESVDGEKLEIFTKVDAPKTKEFLRHFALESWLFGRTLTHRGNRYFNSRNVGPKSPGASLSKADVKFVILAAGAPRETLSLHPEHETKGFWVDDTENLASWRK